jgi:heptosyltransferase-3
VPDSGVMNLAAASPGGVVGLFAQAGGHDDVERWHPIGERARWIFAPTTVAALPDEIVWRELAMLAGAPAAHHA